VATNGYFLDANGNPDPIYFEYESGNDKARILDLEQDMAEIAADGEIFEGFGAGPVSMALGYSWREERYQQVVKAAGVNPAIDPFIRTSPRNNAAIGRRGISQLALDSAQDVFVSAGPFGKGDATVKEAFTEFSIPLVAGARFMDELVFGAAARWADYEQSGEVWSWKGQFSWRVNDQLRLRGTVSQDVRAANMAERTDRNGAAQNIYDIIENPDAKAIGMTAQYRSLTTTFGQPDLRPEEAKTFTAGFVYQPSWLDGMQLSLDWYDTVINDNIVASGSAQEVMDSCYEDKIPRYCDFILREGIDSPEPTAPPGLKRVSNVLLIYINRDWIESGGVDFELSYNRELSLFGGNERASIRFLGSYIDYQNTSTAGVVTSRKGFASFGTAPWQTNLNASYVRNNLTISLGTTYEFGIKINSRNRNQTTGVWDVTDNSYPTQAIWNGQIGYRFNLDGGSTINMSLNVNNLFDKQPWSDPGNAFTFDGVNGDLLGRRYNMSLSYSY
jgi:outer membrane receptor protein involved in Fe transport